MGKLFSIAAETFKRFPHYWPFVRGEAGGRLYYNDVIMSAIASQITGVSIVCSTFCWGADQRKLQSSTSLAFVRGIHRWPVESPHKGPVTLKIFPFDDVVMDSLHQGSVMSSINAFFIASLSILLNEQSMDLRFESHWTLQQHHYGDAIMGVLASQITSPTIVYSNFYSGADQRKHQSSASLAFVQGIHRRPVNSPRKWPVTRKMFPFDDVIMIRLGLLRHTDRTTSWRWLQMPQMPNRRQDISNHHAGLKLTAGYHRGTIIILRISRSGHKQAMFERAGEVDNPFVYVSLAGSSSHSHYALWCQTFWSEVSHPPGLNWTIVRFAADTSCIVDRTFGP